MTIQGIRESSNSQNICMFMLYVQIYKLKNHLKIEMKKRKKPFLPEASPKIWRSNKRTTSELHQTIWHFLQVLTHCNYHQFHKSPAPLGWPIMLSGK